MPPKQKQGNQVKKDIKKASQSAADKTFGLKNKNKSSKVQKQIEQIQQQASKAGNPKDRVFIHVQDAIAVIANRKKAEEAKKAELYELFKPVQISQKVLCVNFKNGNCLRGAKCKFSHDSAVDRKSEKKNMYQDDRVNDLFENWDQEKLADVVLSKHKNPQTTTDIVCKYFLEAIEIGKYGWFWECPNGDQFHLWKTGLTAIGDACKYKHALPPGFKLKSKEKEKVQEEDIITLEEFLETERHKLGKDLTPVTLESFTKWKSERKDKKLAEEEAELRKMEVAVAAGKAGFSGRELFEFNPEMVENESEGEEDVDLSGFRREQVDFGRNSN
ncbi:Translation machinery-associated protein 46 [Neolecta irregularis DAH-3]|uniref:Translation machinery-associated protein 46 n=1 Tax=Neolecta irregularis (strain DAH-3) TaxID=1198029 RepID=A0A1U7LW71_NEOID|nr:Translation machinery-associated protein 46 [Neolecta irregularis DAH-3]|eukprot:OLL26868.1 Translation machinery-associated protein 46 [Neolecta irregularis DAH-3]